MPNTIQLGYINVSKNNIPEEFFTLIETEDTLENYYALLDCTTIDIVRRKIGNRFFTFVVDDEGLLRAGCKFGALSPDCQDGLAGNLLIANQNLSELSSLTEEDFKYLKNNIGMAISPNEEVEYVLLINNSAFY